LLASVLPLDLYQRRATALFSAAHLSAVLLWADRFSVVLEALTLVTHLFRVVYSIRW